MTKLARQYGLPTIKRLYMLSGNECANPDCNNSLLGSDEKTIISEITHIRAASPNGPRYDENMEDEERRGFDNLLLLCEHCHKLVDSPDNESLYPTPLLEEWKKTHESQQLSKRLKDLNFLKVAVKAISEADLQSDPSSDEDLRPINPEEKIQYNGIKRNKSLIEEYKAYYSKINSIYSELEKQGSLQKENLLRNIHSIYLKTIGRYVGDSENKIEIIRNNSDDIFDDIEEQLFELISDKSKNSYFEVLVIMVDAFIRCKILEEPR